MAKLKTNIGNKTERNQLNISMRSQPWYQDWFHSKGLNPNQVQLSKDQQKELQQLTISKGFLDPSDGHIDPAGNVSDFHGWKGLPTAAKVAIIGGATAATLGAGGAFSGGAGAASAGSGAGATAGATGLTTGLGVAPSIAGATTLAGGAGAAGTLGTTAATLGATAPVAKKNFLGKLGSLFGGENKMGNLLTTGGLGFLESALAPKQQQRKSFDGTSADPTRMLTESNDRLKGLFDQLSPRLNEKMPMITPETPMGMGSHGGLPAGIGINGVSGGFGSGASPLLNSLTPKGDTALKLKQRPVQGMSFGPEDPMAHMMENLGLLGVKF